MMKLVRWLAGLLFIASVFVYVLLLALPVFFDPNDYKDQLVTLVEKKTGRQMEIEGDIQLRVSPWLDATCTLGKTRLSGNALFPNSTCIASEQVRMELSILPLLLFRRLQMENVVLDGVTINLIRSKEGMNNWQPLPDASPEQDQAAGAAAPVSPPKETQARPLFTRMLLGISGIDVNGLHLNHVNARYDNRLTNTIILVRDLQIRTGRLRDHIPFPVEANFHLTLDRHGNKTNSSRSGDITMQGNATLFWRERHFLLEDFRLQTTLRGKGLPKRGLRVVATTSSSIHLPQQKITVENFSMTHENATLKGSGTLENFHTPRWSLDLTIPECSPRSILDQLPATRPLLDNDQAFTLLRGSLAIQGNPERLELTDLNLTVDETTLTGNLTRQVQEPPALIATIHANRLDLDRYGAAPPKESAQTENQPPSTDLPLIPTDLLRNLLLQVDLQFDSLKVGGATLAPARVKLDGKNGLLQPALTAILYSGTLKLETRLDVTGNIPTLQIKPRLDKIRLGPLFADMTGKEDVTGIATFQADLGTSGNRIEELLQGMRGSTKLEILNGRFSAFPIREKIEEALTAAQPRTQAPADICVEPTIFDHLSATAVIEDGVLHNHDLRATSKEMEINGTGEIDLVQGLADFALKVALPTPLFPDRGFDFTGSDATVVIPCTISGPLTDLRQHIDVDRLIPSHQSAPTQVAPQPVETREADGETTTPSLVPETGEQPAGID